MNDMKYVGTLAGVKVYTGDLISDCCGAHYGWVQHPSCSTRMAACKKCKKRCNVRAPDIEVKDYSRDDSLTADDSHA